MHCGVCGAPHGAAVAGRGEGLDEGWLGAGGWAGVGGAGSGWGGEEMEAGWSENGVGG